MEHFKIVDKLSTGDVASDLNEIGAKVVGTLAEAGTRRGMTLAEVLDEFPKDWRGTRLEHYVDVLGMTSVLHLVDSFPNKVRVEISHEGNIRLFPVKNDLNTPLFDVVDRTVYRKPKFNGSLCWNSRGSNGYRPYDSIGFRPYDSIGFRPYDSIGFRPHDSIGFRPHDSNGYYRRDEILKFRHLPERTNTFHGFVSATVPCTPSSSIFGGSGYGDHHSDGKAEQGRASRSRCIPGKKLWGDGYGFDGLKDSGGSHRHGFQRRGFNNSRW